MPVDKTMLDAMLGTFRNMLAECEVKKITGPDFDEMKSTLHRMEQLGQEMDDVAAFSGRLMQENLFMKFSEHYGKALTAGTSADQNSATGMYDDAADQKLLQQSVKAYKEAITQLQQSKEQAKKTAGTFAADIDVLFKEKIYTDAIQEVVDLGSSGISYPEFLSRMMQEGIDKAMEGNVNIRAGQVYILEAAEATSAAPFYIKKEEEKLQLFDTLLATSSFKAPDSLLYTLGCEKIEWKYAPQINKWNKVKQGWEKSTFWLDEWVTSFCPFAPFIQPWSLSKNPQEAVVESQKCVPGKLRIWEKINQRYFGLSLKELFRHESFGWDVTHDWMYWSQEYMEFLLNEIEPLCQPGVILSAGLIEKASGFHNEKRKINPALQGPAIRYAAYFDKYFGAGEYIRRFGMPEKAETNAAAWNFETFNF